MHCRNRPARGGMGQASRGAGTIVTAGNLLPSILHLLVLSFSFRVPAPPAPDIDDGRPTGRDATRSDFRDKPYVMMLIRLALMLLILASAPLAAQIRADSLNPDVILVDATFVACGDSTESLLILRDGRAVYAIADRGASFTISGALLTDLQTIVAQANSTVDTKRLDSCSTLGVILNGPRFLLINTKRPVPEVKELYTRIERLRKFAQKKVDGVIDRYSDEFDQGIDSNIQSLPVVAPAEIQKKISLSPIAREWRCRGTVVVAAMVTHQGRARMAFVREVKVRGKCGSILSVAALRAVLLASFEPAIKKNGKPTTTWMQVEVPFTQRR